MSKKERGDKFSQSEDMSVDGSSFTSENIDCIDTSKVLSPATSKSSDVSPTAYDNMSFLASPAAMRPTAGGTSSERSGTLEESPPLVRVLASSTGMGLLKKLGAVATAAAEVHRIISDSTNADSDITILLGNTKSGKSTLVNHIMGNLLESHVGSSRSFSHKIELTSDKRGPEIGTGAASVTKLPSGWFSTKIPGMIWDAPGFADNRGEPQDITNAFSIKTLFTNIRSAKLVLVSDINDLIHHSVDKFIDLITSVTNMFPDIQECLSGVSIIFSKVPDDMSKEMIIEELKEKFMSETGVTLDPKNIPLLTCIVEHPEKIGIFRKILKAGIVPTTIDDGIIQALENSTPVNNVTLSKVIPSITAASEVFLRRGKESLHNMEEFEQCLDGIQFKYTNELKQVYDKITAASITIEEIISERVELERIRESIVPLQVEEGRLYDRLCKIKNCSPEVERFIDEHKMLDLAMVVEFVDAALGTARDDFFNTKISSILVHIISEIDHVRLQAIKCTEDVTREFVKTRLAVIEEEYNNKKAEYEEKLKSLRDNFDKTKLKEIEAAIEDLGALRLWGAAGSKTIKVIKDTAGSVVDVAGTAVETIQKVSGAVTAVKAVGTAATVVKGSCVISYMTEIAYDNALLNHPELVALFEEQYGNVAAALLIDITGELSIDYKDEIEKICIAEHAVELCATLIGKEVNILGEEVTSGFFDI